MSVSMSWGLKKRTLLLALIPTCVISITLVGYFTNLRLIELKQALLKKGEAVTLRMAISGSHFLSSSNATVNANIIQHQASNLIRDDDEIRSINFYTPNRAELLKFGSEKCTVFNFPQRISPTKSPLLLQDNSDNLAYLMPILHHNNVSQPAQLLGWLKVEMNPLVLRLEQYRVIFHSSLIVFAALVLSSLFAIKLAQNLIDPILKLTSAIEQITNGNLKIRIQPGAKWELKILESGINSMVTALDNAHQELQEHVDQATSDLRQTLETIEIQNIELGSAKKAAEEASNIKSEFLATMSHELRTPLNGVIGFVGLLKKTSLSLKQQDYLDTIEKSGINLLAIINDVLDFSKIEAGKFKLRHQPMLLRECIDEACQLLAPLAHEKDLELIPLIDANVPDTIIADPLRVKQIITNLVNNAIKFTNNGHITIKVTTSSVNPSHNHIATQDFACINFEITDTGIGLSSAQQQKLFKAFNQIDHQLKNNKPGTGLGLVICKKLIEQFGGEIKLVSEVNQGSSFNFYIQVPVLPTQNIIYNHYSRVLIYDPNPFTTQALIELCKYWRIEYSIINSITEHQNIFINNQPNSLLIVGINEQKNPQLQNKIIQQAKINFPNCKIGILINSTDLTLQNNILRQNVAFCLAKPISPTKLLFALQHLNTPEQIDDNAKPIPPQLQLLSQPKILAVDDNPANRKLICNLLNNLNCHTVTADSGIRALQLCEQQKFDIIFMDIFMPELNGLETSQKIRDNTNPANLNQQTPIIALSAQLITYEQDDLNTSGINDYLNKPISEHELRAILYRWHQAPIELPDKHKKREQEVSNEMLNMLLESLPTENKLINKAYKDGNYKQLRDLSHKLRGASCYCDTPELTGILAQIEQKIKPSGAVCPTIKEDLNIFNTIIKKLIQTKIIA